MSLFGEQIEDRCSSRGEDEEEEEEEDTPVVALAPDASLPQEQPAADNTDVSASPLQHLDKVIHTYGWTGPKTVALCYI